MPAPFASWYNRPNKYSLNNLILVKIQNSPVYVGMRECRFPRSMQPPILMFLRLTRSLFRCLGSLGCGTSTVEAWEEGREEDGKTAQPHISVQVSASVSPLNGCFCILLIFLYWSPFCNKIQNQTGIAQIAIWSLPPRSIAVWVIHKCPKSYWQSLNTTHRQCPFYPEFSNKKGLSLLEVVVLVVGWLHFAFETILHTILLHSLIILLLSP